VSAPAVIGSSASVFFFSSLSLSSSWKRKKKKKKKRRHWAEFLGRLRLPDGGWLTRLSGSSGTDSPTRHPIRQWNRSTVHKVNTQLLTALSSEPLGEWAEGQPGVCILCHLSFLFFYFQKKRRRERKDTSSRHWLTWLRIPFLFLLFLSSSFFFFKEEKKKEIRKKKRRKESPARSLQRLQTISSSISLLQLDGIWPLKIRERKGNIVCYDRWIWDLWLVTFVLFNFFLFFLPERKDHEGKKLRDEGWPADLRSQIPSDRHWPGLLTASH